MTDNTNAVSIEYNLWETYMYIYENGGNIFVLFKEWIHNWSSTHVVVIHPIKRS